MEFPYAFISGTHGGTFFFEDGSQQPIFYGKNIPSGVDIRSVPERYTKVARPRKVEFRKGKTRRDKQNPRRGLIADGRRYENQQIRDIRHRITLGDLK